MLSLLKKVESAVLGAIMIMASFGYAFVVFVRILLPKLAPALAWVEEASLFLVIVMVFLGLALGLEQGRHIAMSSLLQRLGEASRRKIKIILDLLGLAFSAYLVKIAFDITKFVFQSGQISPTLGMSMAWLYLAMPVGFGLLALRYLQELFSVTNRHTVELEPGQKS